MSCLVIAEIVNKLDRNSFVLEVFGGWSVMGNEIIWKVYIDFIRFWVRGRWLDGDFYRILSKLLSVWDKFS
jgi:hypothetical protein